MMITSGTEIIGGKFVVHELLGKGAFGEVYRATLVSTGGARAIKVVRKDAPGVGSSVLGDYHGRFKAECEIAERVKHPNVLMVYDMFDDPDGLVAALEYAPGGSVADLLSRAGALPIDRAIEILLDAARGLEALHDQAHVVHRDVKPANILLEGPGAGEGRAKIADFGLAQRSGTGGSLRAELGSMAPPHPGDPRYSSPEHACGAEYLGRTADVYGLGCTAFEMLTGRLWKEARDEHERVSELRPDCPAWLDAVVARMLCETPGRRRADAEDPGKRYVTMGAVVAAIERGREEERRSGREESERAARAADDLRLLEEDVRLEPRHRVAAAERRQAEEASTQVGEESRPLRLPVAERIADPHDLTTDEQRNGDTALRRAGVGIVLLVTVALALSALPSALPNPRDVWRGGTSTAAMVALTQEPASTEAAPQPLMPTAESTPDVVLGFVAPQSATLVEHAHASENSDELLAYSDPEHDAAYLATWFVAQLAELGWTDCETRGDSLLCRQDGHLAKRYCAEQLERSLALYFAPISGVSTRADFWIIVEEDCASTSDVAPVAVNTSLRRYVVRTGDTLSAIAARCGVDWRAIAITNRMANPARLALGRELALPTGGFDTCLAVPPR